MKPREFWRQLYKTYIDDLTPFRPEVEPLNYRDFVKATSYMVTGDEHNRDGVLEAYRVYQALCLRNATPVRLSEFVAAATMANPRIREQLARSGAPGFLPMNMN